MLFLFFSNWFVNLFLYFFVSKFFVNEFMMIYLFLDLSFFGVGDLILFLVFFVLIFNLCMVVGLFELLLVDICGDFFLSVSWVVFFYLFLGYCIMMMGL